MTISGQAEHIVHNDRIECVIVAVANGFDGGHETRALDVVVEKVRITEIQD
jgi:hypothetical protein